MPKKLYFIETFDSEFNGRKYSISTFVDYQTERIYRGVGLDTSNLKANTEYTCTIEYSKNKFRVVKVSQ